MRIYIYIVYCFSMLRMSVYAVILSGYIVQTQYISGLIMLHNGILCQTIGTTSAHSVRSSIKIA